ncbi:hypothetical protein D9M68_958600 [compost metagenome]
MGANLESSDLWVNKYLTRKSGKFHLFRLLARPARSVSRFKGISCHLSISVGNGRKRASPVGENSFAKQAEGLPLQIREGPSAAAAALW